jgi:hypothetical protein
MAKQESLASLLEQKYEEFVDNPSCREDYVTREGKPEKRVHCRTHKTGTQAIIWPQPDSWGLQLTSVRGRLRLPINDFTTIGSDPIRVFAERGSEKVSIGLKRELVEAPRIAVAAIQKLTKRMQPVAIYPERNISIEQSLDTAYVLTHDEQGNKLSSFASIIQNHLKEARLFAEASNMPYIKTMPNYTEGCGIAEELHARSATWLGVIISPIDCPEEPLVRLERVNGSPFMLWTNDGAFPTQQGDFLIEENQVLVPVDETVVPSGLSELNPQGLLFLREALEAIQPIPHPEY